MDISGVNQAEVSKVEVFLSSDKAEKMFAALT
jgi:hypothetical protein